MNVADSYARCVFLKENTTFTYTKKFEIYLQCSIFISLDLYLLESLIY